MVFGEAPLDHGAARAEAGEDRGWREFRQDGGVLEGDPAAEGVLNALAERGVFCAPVRFLMTLVGRCTGKGEGIFKNMI